MFSAHTDLGRSPVRPLCLATAVAAIEDFAIYAREKGLEETERLLTLILAELHAPSR